MAELTVDGGTLIKCVAEPDDDIIEVPDGVTRIGPRACYDIKYLRYILLPDGLRGIDEMAFKGCTSLTELELPHAVEIIGRKAFGACASITEISLPEMLKRIDDYAFEDCVGIEGISLPASLEYIGRGAFCGCEMLEHIDVDPDNRHFVSRDGVLFSRDMKRLICCPAGHGGGEFRVPGGVEIIEESAFYGCGFTKIALPRGLKRIEGHAFSHCIALAHIEIPDGLTELGACAFNSCEALNAISIPAQIVQIGDGTFEKCFGLKRVVLPDGLARIGRHAFSGCESLLLDILPGGVREIGDNAFAGCMGLYDLTLPAGLQKVGNGAFMGCGNLERFNIPPALDRVGRYAFFGCPADYLIVEHKWDDDLGDVIIGITCDAVAYLAGRVDDVPDWFKPICARGVAWADGDVQYRMRPYRSGWANWIRKHGDLLWEKAVMDEKLMTVLIKERAIGEDLIEKVTESALNGGNTGIIAMLLQYRRDMKM